MDGRSFANDIAGELFAIAICIAAAGGIIGIGLFVAIPWLFHHVSISIN